MSTTILFDQGGHRNFFLEDFSDGEMVQANQHLIVHDGVGMILDPGGHKIYTRVMSETTSLLAGGKLNYVFLSHQDPDVVAAINGWLMTTDAEAYASQLWTRFIPHFGLDRLVAHRLKGIPDAGMTLSLNGCPLKFLPAHYMHSVGNFQVYDPISKILYSGDLGASVGMSYREVGDFAAHVPHMEGFHQRYMVSNSVLRGWAAMVKTLDIDIIAPQHGAIFKGKDNVAAFIAWCEGLACGLDLMSDIYKVPA